MPPNKRRRRNLSTHGGGKVGDIYGEEEERKGRIEIGKRGGEQRRRGEEVVEEVEEAKVEGGERLDVASGRRRVALLVGI